MQMSYEWLLLKGSLNEEGVPFTVSLLKACKCLKGQRTDIKRSTHYFPYL